MKPGIQFAQVGCGLIGRKRAAALATLPGASLRYACDPDPARAAEVARLVPGCTPVATLEAVLADPEVQAVIVSTPNSALAPAALAAVRCGRHVLLEKPGALNAAELREVQAGALPGTLVRISYNHRFHPALQKARTLVDEGALGPLLFVRGRYGHGGRPGYDREWRSNPKLSGGGELIDQGVHLIDLAGWFRGIHIRGRPCRDVLLGHAGGRQCVPEPEDRRRPDRMASRELHGVEKPVLPRDLRSGWEDRHRRARRQLRHGEDRPVPDAAGDGPPGDDDLGISARR